MLLGRESRQAPAHLQGSLFPITGIVVSYSPTARRIAGSGRGGLLHGIPLEQSD
jgi:hypothetical protein